MSTGTVKWFNPTKGYGFIQPQGGGQDVFVHISAVERAGLSTLNEGQQVEYEVVSNRGKFSVGQVNVEFLQTRMNKPLLEQIAYQTGGKYYDIDRAEELARDLATGAKLGPKETVTTSEIELWNWHYLAALVILLFAVEWFLRKRSGML